MRARRLSLLLVGLSGCLQPIGFGTKQGAPVDDTGGSSDEPAKDPNAPVPTKIADFVEFLGSRGYAAYPTTPTALVPTGPHGVAAVRGYYHPTLAASLEAGNLEHPAGAGAVLELFKADGVTRFGWAASVKLGDFSDLGLNWLWLEAIESNGEVKVLEAGEGLGLCVPCHAAGDDFILGIGR
ncbi:MAG: hypothetical protein FJ095_13220 [Deltaproteobacteria bacterium]|nr:hypothetical protein [Deltaproteobacteria bacterium]